MCLKRILLSFLLVAIVGLILIIRHYVLYTPTLRIGVNAFAGSEFFSLARKALFFEKAGIHVKIVEFGSLEDVQQAFEWNQIDGMVCPLVDAMVIRQKVGHTNPKIILIPSYIKEEFACQILVKNSIKNIQGLKGKKIGVEINSYGGYVLTKALKSEGLTLQDITVVPMDPTAALTFLRHERVDGVVGYPPFISPLKKHMHCIYSSALWPKEMQLNVLLLTKRSIKLYQKKLVNFVKLWDSLLDYYKNNPSSSQKILSVHHSVSPQEADRLFQVVQPLYIEEQIPLFSLNRYVLDILSNINSELLKNNNLGPIQKQEPLDSVFDTYFIKQTVK